MVNGDKDKKLNFKRKRDSAIAKGKKMDADFAAKCKAFKKANPGKQCRDMKFTNTMTRAEKDLYNRYGKKGTVQLSEKGKAETDKRISKEFNT
jgi:hypothetical protein